MTGPTTARARGNWPEGGTVVRAEKTVPITFNMPADLYGWLAGFVGNYSYFFNVEEALITAVRCMAGKDHDDGCDLASLTAWTAEAKGVSYAQAFKRDTAKAVDTAAVVALLSAASLAASYAPIVPASLMPDDPKQDELVRKFLAVVGVAIEE